MRSDSGAGGAGSADEAARAERRTATRSSIPIPLFIRCAGQERPGAGVRGFMRLANGCEDAGRALVSESRAPLPGPGSMPSNTKGGGKRLILTSFWTRDQRKGTVSIDRGLLNPRM